MSQRLRNFCFTKNNYNEQEHEDIVSFLQEKAKYFVIGKEVGEKGTKHLQGYAELNGQNRFESLRKSLYNSHIENRKGTALQASDYCKKDGDFVEYGEISKPGKRNDLSELKKSILENPSIKDNMDMISNLQHLKFAECLLKYSDVKRNEPVTVIWLHGKSGCGKSYRADTEAKAIGKYYTWRNTQGKWFDGYDGEKTLILDDLRKDDFKYTQLLAILDRYPCKIETKGGTRELLATTIYITSVKSPHDFQIDGESNEQLFRRITKIINMSVSQESVSEVGGNTNPDLLNIEQME